MNIPEKITRDYDVYHLADVLNAIIDCLKPRTIEVEVETPTPKTVEEVAREINNGLASMLIAWIAIELIFGADDFIYWVANLIA